MRKDRNVAKETKPVTYRVSLLVDKTLRKLAKEHGGIDRALRHLMRLPKE